MDKARGCEMYFVGMFGCFFEIGNWVSCRVGVVTVDFIKDR